MTKIPEFKPGDLIKVYVKVIEGDKTRLSPFQGVVVQIKGSGDRKTFIVRKVSAGIGVERIFPLNSPMIARIEVKRKGKVRRAKLTYLRNKKVKKLKSQELIAPKQEAVEKPEEKKVEGTN
ncbi:MAG: 50S ribosomal protein L19 [candidate division WOR-3 bacterium]